MSTALRSLSNSDLLRSTKQVVARERGITIEVLHHFSEIDWRKLYLELGHTSLFTYCTDELGYSASAAKRRIATARCIAQFPEILPLLTANEVNLSTITQVSRIMTVRNSYTILDRIRGKSQREVDAIVAEFEPLAALPKDRARTVVVRVPAEAASAAARAGCEAATSATVPPALFQDCSKPEPQVSAQPAMQLERRVLNQFAAREVVMNKIESVRALASHRLPMNAPLEQVIEFLADYFLKREDPRARHERRTEKADHKPQMPSASNPRAIPIAVRDEVYVKNEGKCCYVGPDGKRCASSHVVQVDHVVPVARGGSASIENLRLLCAEHNRMEAERVLGKAGQRPVPRSSAIP